MNLRAYINKTEKLSDSSLIVKEWKLLYSTHKAYMSNLCLIMDHITTSTLIHTEFNSKKVLTLENFHVKSKTKQKVHYINSIKLYINTTWHTTRKCLLNDSVTALKCIFRELCFSSNYYNHVSEHCIKLSQDRLWQTIMSKINSHNKNKIHCCLEQAHPCNVRMLSYLNNDKLTVSMKRNVKQRWSKNGTSISKFFYCSLYWKFIKHNMVPVSLYL